MDKNKKSPPTAGTVGEEESDFKIEGMEEATKIVNELVMKIREAKEIANELASTEIILNDKRQKDIVDYISELRKGFIENSGCEPHKSYLVAEGHSFEFRLALNL